jgi:hypothetical protein
LHESPVPSELNIDYDTLETKHHSSKQEESPADTHFVPPAPPPPPPALLNNNNTVTKKTPSVSNTNTAQKQHQPLSSISIQDLNSVQLRRTESKMFPKPFSSPMRSVSLQCLSSTNEQFTAQKVDLIEELKMSKDIIGIKKMKVERAKKEDPRNSEVYSDLNRQFSMQNFVNTVNSHEIFLNIFFSSPSPNNLLFF